MRSTLNILAGATLLAVFAAGTIVVYSFEAAVWKLGDLVGGLKVWRGMGRKQKPTHSP
jgi:hypothetical protein